MIRAVTSASGPASWLTLTVLCLGALSDSALGAQSEPASASATLPGAGSSPIPVDAAQRPGANWQSIATLPALAGSWGPVEQTLAETIALDNIAYPPLKPAQLALSKRSVQSIIDGKTDQPSAGCKPPGIPWSLWYAYGPTIVFTPGAVVMFINGIRTIVTDGSPLPTGISDPNSLETPPTDLGYSVGHWEGDTLVVETGGLSADNLVAHGVPNGGGMSIRERYRLVTPDRLELLMTVDAPKVLAKPWEVKREFTRAPMMRIGLGDCDPAVSREKLDANGNLSLDLTPPSERNRKSP